MKRPAGERYGNNMSDNVTSADGWNRGNINFQSFMIFVW
jgi:hypothetical protein